MSEQPWGMDEDNPAGEGSEPTVASEGGIAERRAADDPTAWDGTDVRPDDRPPAYDSEEEHAPEAGEQGGRPNLSPDPPVAGRPSRFGQGSTDDSPGTPSGL
ncbi:hypothetical protein ODJ79_09060 [Actinoplanes sp. KI2]|uniref:hypothetical protein n=1 Tax=Actinoplanes sp. KI2 TaxID=2983315 RepID=UPI0021D5939F|nr:hypothetical protein [Actinoplanes sp. KI2]MCU7723861.1 hypothetical protein [Actinoplanes sp. KI2]